MTTVASKPINFASGAFSAAKRSALQKRQLL
jgi:hypothetical protein